MGIMGVFKGEKERHMAKDLISDLEGGLCLVKFRSLKSGKVRELEFTLSPEYTAGTPIKINQHEDNDKILMYNCTFEKWDDLERETILEWIKLY